MYFCISGDGLKNIDPQLQCATKLIPLQYSDFSIACSIQFDEYVYIYKKARRSIDILADLRVF
jgi:hypothetical protein